MRNALLLLLVSTCCLAQISGNAVDGVTSLKGHRPRKTLSITSKEKIYIHLDKSYYYPGETIWFKGYVKFDNPAIDSLSSVVYVELINPQDRIVRSKAVKIERGSFYNDFSLSDTLRRGNYYLRAYTNFDRNFGDENLFVKPLFLLSANNKVEPSQPASDDVNGGLLVTSDKRTYKPREKITLSLRTEDKKGNLLGFNLSVAVTDAIQVVPLPYAYTIEEHFTLETEQKVFDFTYPADDGISFEVQYHNKKGKAEKTAFFSADLPGRYQIVVEGINQFGEPVRSVSFIEINDDGTK